MTDREKARFAAQIDAFLTERTRQDRFSGVVLVSCGGKPFFHRAYGDANRADRVPNALETRFGLASVTKMFTAVAVAQLAERGAISFQAPVREYRGDLPGEMAEQVTIHHLLTHTSGICDYFDEVALDSASYAQVWASVPMYRMRSPGDLLPLFRDKPAQFEPGSRFSYCNAGYILLGLIIEAVAGASYVDYVTEHVFQRAGMVGSGFFELDCVHPRVAVGYIPPQEGEGDVGWKTNCYSIPVKGAPDGGSFSTAADLDAFFTALMRHDLLGEPASTGLLSARAAENDIRSYGYGVWIVRQKGRLVRFGHGGEDPGASARAYHWPEQGRTAVVLANMSDAAGEVFTRIEELLP
jgi:CubicO group peptidase (beta-lactamase class C family)